MAGDEVGLRQADVAPDHVERRVAEDPLEAEHVTAVDEVAFGRTCGGASAGCIAP